MTVFQLIIADKVPESSQAIPLVGTMIITGTGSSIYSGRGFCPVPVTRSTDHCEMWLSGAAMPNLVLIGLYLGVYEQKRKQIAKVANVESLVRFQ